MDIIENVHNKNRPMPEIFSRNDIRNTGGWDVGNVRAVRGEPFITVSGRIMRVPLDDSQLARAIRAHEQMHGKTSVITTDEKGVYKGLPKQFTVIRYHSLAIERETLPDCLEITSTTEDGEIMGVRHKGPQTDKRFAPLEGVQFHPESILTEHGHAMLANFLKM